jgi:hypothetical protein
METQQLGDAAVNAKEEKSNWWWPRTDTLEHARDAAKGGSIAFGLLAIGQLIVVAFGIFTAHKMILDDYLFHLATALVIYLAWRTYKRPTILLNSVAFVWIGVELGFKIFVVLLAASASANNVNLGPLVLPTLATAAALGGIRGSLAVRRFNKVASPS